MNHAQIRKAANIIRRGGVIAYATEYCFGLGCDPHNHAAVMRVLRVKRRAVTKGLILIAADVEQLGEFVADIPSEVLASWPGPHTWLLEPRIDAPAWIRGRHPRIAVRVTAHPQAAALCRAAGMAVVSTSANRGGQVPARRYRTVLQQLGRELDFVLPGRIGDSPAPTSIRDGVTKKLIRAG